MIVNAYFYIYIKSQIMQLNGILETVSKIEEGEPDTGKVTCPRSYIKLVPGRTSADP